MIPKLGKLRSIWRKHADSKQTAVAPTDEVPVGVHTDLTGSPSAVHDAPADKIEESAVVSDDVGKSTARRGTQERLTALIASLRGDLRTLESRIETIQTRNDRFMQSAQPTTPRDSADIDALRADLRTLTDQTRTLTDRLDSVEGTATRLEASREINAAKARELEADHDALATLVERQTLRLTESQERAAELAHRIEDLQSVVQSTIESVNTTRAEVIANDVARSREIAGRLVGLYLIGCIALTVALATLFILLMRVNL